MRFSQSLELAPTSHIHTSVSYTYFYLGRYLNCSLLSEIMYKLAFENVRRERDHFLVRVRGRRGVGVAILVLALEQYV